MGNSNYKNSPEYKNRAVSALVLLHEEHIRSFLKTWRQAKQGGVKLPETEDPDYISMETLLVHVLRSSGGYMRWVCEKLGLPDPDISQVPPADQIEKESDSYVEYLIEKWSIPLASIEGAEILDQVYESKWGVKYSIEAMLEHAVMHPVRHEFQLKNLINKVTKTPLTEIV